MKSERWVLLVVLSVLLLVEIPPIPWVNALAPQSEFQSRRHQDASPAADPQRNADNSFARMLQKLPVDPQTPAEFSEYLINNPSDLPRLATQLAKRVHLQSIRFANKGDAIDGSATFAKTLLTKLGRVQISKPLPGLPEITPENALDMDSLDSLLASCRFLRAQGRTLVYETAQGKLICLKLKKEEEHSMFLAYESKMFDYFEANKIALGLWGHYPKSRLVQGKRIIKTKSLSPECVEALAQQRDHQGNPLRLSKTDGKYTLMAYTLDDPDYLTYLNSPNLTLEEFKQASRVCLHDLFTLAKQGIFFTVLADMFHSPRREEWSDRGRYLWMVDVIGPFGGRHGAGDLEEWPQGMRYPNPRKSGMADLAEIRSLNVLMQPDEPTSAHLKDLRKDHLEYDIQTTFLANYLGEYLFTWVLLYGSYLRESDPMVWQAPDEIAQTLKDNFEFAFQTFADLPLDACHAISGTIDWDMLAKQMILCMPKDNRFAQYLLDKKFLHGIFHEDTKIEFETDYRKARGWRKSPFGEGWYSEEGHPHLGGPNSPFPVQGLIEALYKYVSLGLLIKQAMPAETPDAHTEMSL